MCDSAGGVSFLACLIDKEGGVSSRLIVQNECSESERQQFEVLELEKTGFRRVCRLHL